MRRLLALAPLALLISACTGTEQPTTDPAPDSAPATVPVESQPNPVSESDGPEYFFAVVSQTGFERCANGMDSEWVGVEPVLGWTRTSGVNVEALDALMGQAVLARGSAGPAPKQPAIEQPADVQDGLCPPMQMRSDWVSTPRGMRVRRTASIAAEHFHLTSVRRLDELTIEASGDQITASFTNPLPFALAGVRLRMHYEGCYGKPGSAELASEAAAELGPGEVLSHSFPRWAEQNSSGAPPNTGPATGRRKNSRPADRRHLAASLVLEIAGSEGSEAATIWTDLDVSLREFGIPFECD